MSRNKTRSAETIRRVCVIGLDGATFRVLKPLCEQGHLPCLSGLIRGGAHGELQSTIPPVTAAAWASFLTGKRPDRHGVFEFLRYDPNSYQTTTVNASAIQARTIWEILDQGGKSALSINVPMTYPPRSLDNITMVSGLLSPELAAACHPPSLAQEIASLVPDYQFIVPVKAFDYLSLDDYVARLVRLAENRATLGKALMQRDWHFMMLHFQATDIAQHALWSHIDPAHPSFSERSPKDRATVLGFFRRIDEIIGEIEASLDDSTLLIVMSDHGFGPATRRLYVNEWLMQQRLLAVKRKWRKTITLRMVEALRHLDILKLRRRWIGPRSWAEDLQTSLTGTGMIDWEHTGVFALPGSFYAQLYLNTRGRQPHGTVNHEAAEPLARQVKERLLQWTDPVTGERVVDNVYLKHEIYSADTTGTMPDLVIEPAPGYMIATDLVTGTLVGDLPPFLTGTHRRDGILIARGPGIREDFDIGRASIIDVLPSILYALEIAIPSDLDGEIIRKLFDATYTTAHQAIYDNVRDLDGAELESGAQALSDEEMIEDRLRSLGYLG